MSKENFLAEEAAILAINKEAVQAPTMPLPIYLQESEDLGVWLVPDKGRLRRRGIDVALIDGLDTRSGALRYQQGIWQSDTKARSRSLEEWKLQYLVGEDLRAEMLHFFRFAFDKKSDLKQRLAEISANGGQADTIQDLMSLSVLGSQNKALLRKINYDLAKLDQAAALSETLGDLLALNNDNREKGNEVKDLRDRAYTHLKTAVDEIRRYGKLEFWREPERLKGYASDYRRK